MKTHSATSQPHALFFCHGLRVLVTRILDLWTSINSFRLRSVQARIGAQVVLGRGLWYHVTSSLHYCVAPLLLRPRMLCSSFAITEGHGAAFPLLLFLVGSGSRCLEVHHPGRAILCLTAGYAVTEARRGVRTHWPCVLETAVYIDSSVLQGHRRNLWSFTLLSLERFLVSGASVLERMFHQAIHAQLGTEGGQCCCSKRCERVHTSGQPRASGARPMS